MIRAFFPFMPSDFDLPFRPVHASMLSCDIHPLRRPTPSYNGSKYTVQCLYPHIVTDIQITPFFPPSPDYPTFPPKGGGIEPPCTLWTFLYSSSSARCMSKSACRSFLSRCCSMSRITPACIAWVGVSLSVQKDERETGKW